MKTLLSILLTGFLFLTSSVAQTQPAANCNHLKKAMEMPEMERYFKLCAGTEPLTVVDRSGYFLHCSFNTCTRSVTVTDRLTFKIDVNHCCGNHPKNKLIADVLLGDNTLIINFYNPSNNTTATVKITNYKTGQAVYSVSNVGVF